MKSSYWPTTKGAVTVPGTEELTGRCRNTAVTTLSQVSTVVRKRAKASSVHHITRPESYANWAVSSKAVDASN